MDMFIILELIIAILQLMIIRYSQLFNEKNDIV